MALVYQSRLVQVLDPENIAILFSCRFAGIGALYTSFIGEYAFYLSPENGVLAKIAFPKLSHGSS